MHFSSGFCIGRRCRLWLILTLFVVVGASSTPALAQSNNVEIFGGFSYFRADTSLRELAPAGFGLDHINSYGWHAAATQYPWNWFGATVDVSGYYAQPTITVLRGTYERISNLVKTSTYTIMAGPSFAYRKHSSVQPFAHILVGGVYGKASLTSKGREFFGSNASAADWSFGYGAGGGVDVRIARMWALRGEADYIGSSFSNGGDDHQSNIRASGGLVFRF